MPKDTDTKSEERIVQAHILHHTSIDGRLLIANSVVPLTIAHAKSLQAQGHAEPVPKVLPSHPKTPPRPPAPRFEDQDEDPDVDASEVVDDSVEEGDSDAEDGEDE